MDVYKRNDRHNFLLSSTVMSTCSLTLLFSVVSALVQIINYLNTFSQNNSIFLIPDSRTIQKALPDKLSATIFVPLA